MMKLNKVFAVISTLLMILSCSFFPVADAVLLEYQTKDIPLSLQEITSTINTYFSQRHMFLGGEITNISVAVTPLVDDENTHQAFLRSNNIIRTGMQIMINNICLGDAYAEVDVTETIIYKKDNEECTSYVEHVLLIYPVENATPLVASDAYCENFSSFKSCSYISYTNAMLSITTDDGGSSACIVHVASGEIGHEETGTNMTKYGEWYGGNGNPWCAMFVSWCADQSNVSTSVIMKDWGCDAHMNHFKNSGRFHISAAYGGSTLPQEGDIIFFGPNQSDSTHVGIVVSSDSSNVYYIEGNSSDNNVRSSSKVLTNTSILGYGRPNYATSAHTRVYNSNSLYHWSVCNNCGYQSGPSDHIWVVGSATNTYVCKLCGKVKFNAIESVGQESEGA